MQGAPTRRFQGALCVDAMQSVARPDGRGWGKKRCPRATVLVALTQQFQGPVYQGHGVATIRAGPMPKFGIRLVRYELAL